MLAEPCRYGTNNWSDTQDTSELHNKRLPFRKKLQASTTRERIQISLSSRARIERPGTKRVLDAESTKARVASQRKPHAPKAQEKPPVTLQKKIASPSLTSEPSAHAPIRPLVHQEGEEHEKATRIWSANFKCHPLGPFSSHVQPWQYQMGAPSISVSSSKGIRGYARHPSLFSGLSDQVKQAESTEAARMEAETYTGWGHLVSIICQAHQP